MQRSETHLLHPGGSRSAAPTLHFYFCVRPFTTNVNSPTFAATGCHCWLAQQCEPNAHSNKTPRLSHRSLGPPQQKATKVTPQWPYCNAIQGKSTPDFCTFASPKPKQKYHRPTAAAPTTPSQSPQSTRHPRSRHEKHHFFRRVEPTIRQPPLLGASFASGVKATSKTTTASASRLVFSNTLVETSKVDVA